MSRTARSRACLHVQKLMRCQCKLLFEAKRALLLRDKLSCSMQCRTEADYPPDTQSAEPEGSPDFDTGPPLHLEAPLEEPFGAHSMPSASSTTCGAA